MSNDSIEYQQLHPVPQVTITVHGQQVRLTSNLTGTGAWQQIRQVCYDAMLAAHAEVVKEQLGQQAPLIEVPSLRAVRG